MNRINIKNIYNEDVIIEVVDNENEANFITHSGTFHADEIMASVILLNKFGSMKIYRTNKVLNTDAFVYDVGFGKFDHHGIDFNESRENGIKYASCGLVWKAFGKDIISKLGIEDINAFFESVDKNLIMDIDRDDNGQALKNEPEVKPQSIPSIIGSFNPAWNVSGKENECFLSALSFANIVFNNMLTKMIAKEEARKIVEDKIEESNNGILLLDMYMPWKDIVLTSKNPKAKGILYAVFPSKRGGYNVVATPILQGSFEVKKPFPSSWAGKEDLELKQISGVRTITFCHKNLFICACETYEDAIKIAEISINNKENENEG